MAIVPVVSIANASVVEGNSGSSNATLTVTLSAATTQTVTVNYATANGTATATAGSDYSTATGTLTFAPGESSKTLSVPILGDTTQESDETVLVSLSAPVSATVSPTAGMATLTISNDDQAVLPIISIVGTTVSEGNSGSSKATLTVSLSAASKDTVTVNYASSDGTATENSDYVSVSGKLTFAPGETSKTLAVPVIGDTSYESNETLQITLTTPSNANLNPDEASATLTINNDDLPVVTIANASVDEGNSGSSDATMTVTLSTPPFEEFTVHYATSDGTAQEGSDYVDSSGDLTFAAGETSQSFSIPVLGDKTLETDETVKINLSSANGASLGSATLSITNDDVLQQTIDLGPSYGKLICPVNVDGHWYYYWDRSGDGTSADMQGTGYVNATDNTTHDVLDEIFNQDINGTVGGGGNTDDTYRYATLNGVHVALPTVGDVIDSTKHYLNYAKGTEVGGSPASAGSIAINPIYDDLLAVWDAYNGTGTGTMYRGIPPGWSITTDYGSSTPSALGHASVDLFDGYVYNYYDSQNLYVALEVL